VGPPPLHTLTLRQPRTQAAHELAENLVFIVGGVARVDHKRVVRGHHPLHQHRHAHVVKAEADLQRGVGLRECKGGVQGSEGKRGSSVRCTSTAERTTSKTTFYSQRGWVAWGGVRAQSRRVVRAKAAKCDERTLVPFSIFYSA